MMLAYIYFLMFFVLQKCIRNVVFFCFLKLKKELLIYFTNTSFCSTFLIFITYLDLHLMYFHILLSKEKCSKIPQSFKCLQRCEPTSPQSKI